jgi:hypothetical protein
VHRFVAGRSGGHDEASLMHDARRPRESGREARVATFMRRMFASGGAPSNENEDGSHGGRASNGRFPARRPSPPSKENADVPLAHLASILALPALGLLAAPAAAVPPSASVPAASAAVAGAATVDPLPHPPVVDRLDNGLTLVTVPFDAPGIVSYYTLVKAGSRDEVEPGKSGYAHLFEHLMFRGTDAMSAADYEARMQAMGADNNAWTSNDLTVYVPTIPKEGLAELIPIEADRFQHLHVAEDKYKDETGAVLGEYNKAFANPARVMDEALRTLAFRSRSARATTSRTCRTSTSTHASSFAASTRRTTA